MFPPQVRHTLLLAAIAGCQCPGGGGPDAGFGRVVTVSRMRTLVSDAGRETQSFDLDQAELSALVFDDAGLYVIYPTTTGPGTGEFRDVPDGSYFVVLNGYNLQTNSNAL